MGINPNFVMGSEAVKSRDSNLLDFRYDVETADGSKLTFRIMKWKPSKVFARIPTLGKVFAVPVSMLLAERGNPLGFQEALPTALLHLFSTMEDVGTLDFVRAVLDEVYFDNVAVNDNFDEVFMNYPEAVFDLVQKVLEVHYEPFFKKGFSGLLGSLTLPTKLASS